MLPLIDIVEILANALRYYRHCVIASINITRISTILFDMINMVTKPAMLFSEHIDIESSL